MYSNSESDFDSISRHSEDSFLDESGHGIVDKAIGIVSGQNKPHSGLPQGTAQVDGAHTNEERTSTTSTGITATASRCGELSASLQNTH